MKNLFVFVLLSVNLSGCILTKVISTPLRATGSVVSVIPIVGGGAQTILSTTADSIDIVGIILD